MYFLDFPFTLLSQRIQLLNIFFKLKKLMKHSSLYLLCIKTFNWIRKTLMSVSKVYNNISVCYQSNRAICYFSFFWMLAHSSWAKADIFQFTDSAALESLLIIFPIHCAFYEDNMYIGTDKYWKFLRSVHLLRLALLTVYPIDGCV